MAADDFIWAVAPGMQSSIKFRTRKAQFGDGYSQAVADGINARLQTWPVRITADSATISAVKSFLDSKAGHQSFTWTPPGESQARWRAGEYTFTPEPDAIGYATLSVTFEQVFV